MKSSPKRTRAKWQKNGATYDSAANRREFLTVIAVFIIYIPIKAPISPLAALIAADILRLQIIEQDRC
jgi:hypothetical protein